VVAPSGTDTATTDLYPSQTAISLYYTPSGKQGVGAITGAAPTGVWMGALGAVAGGVVIAVL